MWGGFCVGVSQADRLLVEFLGGGRGHVSFVYKGLCFRLFNRCMYVCMCLKLLIALSLPEVTDY